MRMQKHSWLLALALPAIFSTEVARADTLAPGDPATLLTLNDEFITDLDAPTSVGFLPDGRVVVTEKGGAFKIFEADGSNLNGGANQFVSATFPVDASSEKGLLKVVVHPDFPSNRRLIFYYSRQGTPVQSRHRVSSFPLGEDNMLDLGQEQILVDNLIGPANHDGGGLSIANGMLYIGVGDTGCNKSPISGDGTPQNYNPTCLTNANGKILRINLDGSIPATNPLVGMNMVTSCDGVSPDPAGTGNSRCVPGDAPTTLGAPRQEILAWGFRNPWRLWADPRTNYVWVGDVGEQHNEEVNVITAGGKHYGWPFREGTGGDEASVCTGVTAPDPGVCVDPTYFYTHADGSAITGGPVIIDCRWPAALQNRYIFGDAVSGRIWSMAVDTATNDRVTGDRADFITGLPTGSPGSAVVDFEMGLDGALYYVVIDGSVTRVAPLAPIDCNPDAGPGTGGAAAGGSAGAAAGGAPGGGTTGTSGGASAGGASGGTPGTGGVPTGSGGTSAGGGAAKKDSGEEGGCGCRMAGGGGEAALGLLALALGSLAFGSRRKRRSDKS